MHHNSFAKSLVCLAVVSTLYACGGGGSSLSPESETSGLDSAAANQAPANQTPVAQAPAAGADTTLVGRVADGYIRGATVCLDLNENGSCDADEPTATTGEGGLYELAMIDGAEGKAILADIPATAIDEDNNLPIGKRMMLSAPASKREFISPITTLVQQELENNPAIDLDEAEASVKQELGLSIEDDDASLFADYVAHGDDADTGDDAERFRHMHRTAQVVAKMMQEIQNSAESAVVEQGIDLDGDPAARKALQKAVRKEIRKLLPEIAEAVSDRIAEAREDAAADADTGEEFDASQLAEQFIPAEAIDAEEIINEKDLPQVEAVTVEAMLTDGFYWFDVSCSVSEYNEYNEDVDSDVDPVPDFDCAAGYTHIMLGDDGKHIDETNYEYDSAEGLWVAHEEFNDESDHVWHLVDGQWVSVSDSADTTVEFTADGGAVIEHSDGKMVIKAVQRSLAGQHIARHLYDFDHSQLAVNDSLFPSESSEYLFKIKRKDSQYALFNWYGDDDGSCVEHNGNCNVINQVTDNGVQAVESLAAVTDGIVLAGLLHNEYGRSLNVVLHSKQGDGWGKAQWVENDDDRPEYPFDEGPVCEPYNLEGTPDKPVYVTDPDGVPEELLEPFDGELPSEHDIEEELKKLQLMQDEAMDVLPSSVEYSICAAPPSELVLNDFDIDADGVVDFEQINDNDADADGEFDPGFNPETDSEFDPALNPELDPNFGPDLDPALDIDGDGIVDIVDEDAGNSTDTDASSNSGNGKGHSFGRWRTVEVDGVKMVELTLPFALRHHIDFDDSATVMLIEHEGFVRRGAHFSNRSVETETAYNPVAFEALLVELEKQMGANTDR